MKLEHQNSYLKVLNKHENHEINATRKGHKGSFWKLDSNESSKQSGYTKMYKTPMKVPKVAANTKNSDKSGTKDTYIPTIEFDMLADKNISTIERQTVSNKHTEILSKRKFNETSSLSKINKLQSSQKIAV